MITRENYLSVLKFLYEHSEGYTKAQLKAIFLKEMNLTVKEFEKILKVLRNIKVVVKDKHKRYYVNRRNDFLEGTFVITQKSKFVVGTYLDGSKEQLLVNDMNTNDAFYKDKVLAIKIGKNECKILHCFEHIQTKLTGIYMDARKNGEIPESESYGFVLLDNKNYNKDIHISFENKNGAVSYDKVEVEIQPEITGKNPEGIILRIHAETNKDEMMTLDEILDRNRIQIKHSQKAMNQIKKTIAYENNNISYEILHRKNLTEECIFTIDGEDSKDLDDAISLKILDNGNRLLGVHIADVSHYVTEGSRIDSEALERGTSIYLINKVIPMLPPILSNDLCSLNPNQLRLTLSCEMEIDENGEVVHNSIFESYIKSRAKLNYPQVTAFFEHTDEGKFEEDYPEIAQVLLNMKELMLILNKKRLQRGSLEFESQESKIELNEEEVPVSIKKYKKTISNDLIEEFMLVCNETVAKTYFEKLLPFIFRVHENPREEKFSQLQEFVKKYGYSISVDYNSLNSKDIQNMLHKLSEKDFLPISLMVLRTLQQARYKEFCTPHFGLASSCYTHFTSPIRRYPDLMIHRIIKEDLKHSIDEYRKKDLEDIVKYVAKECSKKERIADNIENDYENLKKAIYMENNINTFKGIVTNLTHDDIEITLENTIIGRYRFNKTKNSFQENQFVIVDEDGNVSFELGQTLFVKVKKVDLLNLIIFFEIVEDEIEAQNT